MKTDELIYYFEHEIGKWKFHNTYEKYGVVSHSLASKILEEDINLKEYLTDQTQIDAVEKAFMLLSSLINEFYKRKIFEEDYSNCNY